jgi:hypothetical protein
MAGPSSNRYFPENYAIQSQHESWDEIVKNRNMIPDFPRGDAVANFRLITGHDCLAAHLQRLLIYSSPMCILCNEEKSIMNKDHLKNVLFLILGIIL